METADTNFVKRYEPGVQARVELKNGRILDVVHGRYFNAGTSVILQGGKGGFVHGWQARDQQLRPRGGIQRDSAKLRKSIAIAR